MFRRRQNAGPEWGEAEGPAGGGGGPKKRRKGFVEQSCVVNILTRHISVEALRSEGHTSHTALYRALLLQVVTDGLADADDVMCNAFKIQSATSTSAASIVLQLT